ncbi:MAG TPA: Lrp/AsnC family transcriptional regulator [Candidatus Latescibacteria bacterium]|nr:Lrp/AsnC family transcriptional regulator [Candidatus Latescibacterota bacterium]
MPVAFVLIEVEAGKIPDVVKKLSDIDEVVEVYSVAGPYDVVAKVQVEDYETFGQVIPEKVGKISGIGRTLTLVAFKFRRSS